jgi:hypothetical protein
MLPLPKSILVLSNYPRRLKAVTLQSLLTCSMLVCADQVTTWSQFFFENEIIFVLCIDRCMSNFLFFI